MEEKEVKTVHRNGFLFSFKNEKEFESIFEEIFVKKTWEWKSKKPSPNIVDVGSHIGISILYFKSIFPEAHIKGFEPNPYTFQLLQKNILQNDLKKVSIVNAALSDREGEIEFFIGKNNNSQNWSWGDAAVKNKWYDPSQSKTIKVRSLKLSEQIDGEVDVLKLDVEGMEEIILRESEPRLKKVKEIILEFHGSTTNPYNDIEEVLELLKRNGYSTKINQDWKWISRKDIKKPDPHWASIYATR